MDYTLDIQGVAPERFESATILKKAGNDALCAILCGPRSLRKTHFDYLQRLGPPLIVFQEVFQTKSDNVALIHQDDLAGGSMLAKLLLRKRVRSVLFVRPLLDWCAVEQREKGVRAVFSKQARAPDVKTLLTPSEGFDDVEGAVREYLSQRIPDAIVAATDSVAGAVLSACEAHGLTVPKDIAVTGFNGFDVWRYTRPALTTIRSPAYEMGRYAGELLMERLQGSAFSKRNSVFPVSLHEGGSA